MQPSGSPSICLAIVLPSAAAQLWRDRHAMSAAAAWAIWLIALGMTLLAAIGFAATNIGDGVAGRSKVAAEASALAADIERLRSERAAITEMRAVSTIEAEIQRAQPAAAAVWKQTAGCSNVTMAASGAACADVLKLRQALGVAQRRDALDAELRSAETRLAPLPAITSGDPQATMAADIVAWISLGHVNLTPHDIHRMRITGLDHHSGARRHHLHVRHHVAAGETARARRLIDRASKNIEVVAHDDGAFVGLPDLVEQHVLGIHRARHAGVRDDDR